MTTTVTTTAEAADLAPRRRVPMWVLAALTLTGSLAMHIFVPALAAAGKALSASESEMQMTITLYIVGMAAGQLIYGPLSDRFGRRPVLFGAISLYVAAGFACYFAPAIGLLLLARFLQAVGGCAGLVLARAILRDTSEAREIAQRMAVLTMIMVAAPSIAPLTGGLVTQYFGWRAVFLVLIGIGTLNLASIMLILPETRPAEEESASFLTGVKALLSLPAFRWLALGGACATTSMYGVITAAPFIFEKDLHRPATDVGPWLAAVVLAVAGGNLVVKLLADRVALPRLLVIANWLTLTAGLLLLAVALFVPLTALRYIAPVFLFCFATGVTSPIATTQALSLRPGYAGAASGLYGFVQMVVAALCTLAVSFGGDPALAAAVVTATVGALAMLSFRLAARHRDGAEPDGYRRLTPRG